MIHFFLRCFLGAAGWFALAAVLSAAPSPAIESFPPVDRVLREIQGANPRDTQARQVGALRQLWHMVASVTQGRAETPEESRVRQSYNLAMGKIDRAMMATFDPADSAKPGFRAPRARWVALCAMYEADEALRDEILQRFFPTDFQRRYGAAIRDGNFVMKHSSAELRQDDEGPAMEALQNLPWYKGPAFVLAVVTAFFFLWFLWALRNELRPRGLDPRDPHLLRAGRRKYLLVPVTGILIDERKLRIEESTTTTTRDPTVAGGERTSTVVKKTKSHRFNIATPDGEKTLLWLFHHRAKVGEGHRVSAVKVAHVKTKYGDYLYFFDHTTAVRSHDGPACTEIFRPRYTLLWAGTCLAVCAGLYARAADYYPANRAHFPSLFDYTGAVAQDAPDVVFDWIKSDWLAWLGVAVAYVFVAHVIGALRARSFLRAGCDALAAELTAETRRQEAAGFDASNTPRER